MPRSYSGATSRSYSDATCKRTERHFPPSPVSGETWSVDGESCSHERLNTAGCGPQGIYFEVQKSLFDKVIAWYNTP